MLHALVVSLYISYCALTILINKIFYICSFLDYFKLFTQCQSQSVIRRVRSTIFITQLLLVSLTKVSKAPKAKPAFVEKVSFAVLKFFSLWIHPEHFFLTTFQVRSLVNHYKFIYVIKLVNSRNQRLVDLRRELNDSVLLFGKNKLMMIAFGRDKTQEIKSGLYKLGKFIKGQCALLFTNRNLDEVRAVFNQFRSADYARPGVEAEQTVIEFPSLCYVFPSKYDHAISNFVCYRSFLELVLSRNLLTLWSIRYVN